MFSIFLVKYKKLWNEQKKNCGKKEKKEEEEEENENVVSWICIYHRRKDYERSQKVTFSIFLFQGGLMIHEVEFPRYGILVMHEPL